MIWEVEREIGRLRDWLIGCGMVLEICDWELGAWGVSFLLLFLDCESCTDRIEN